jgi:hypothetical protein
MPAAPRGDKRFQISCPITLEIRRRARPPLLQKGSLLDITQQSANVYLQGPVAVGTRVVLKVHFMNGEEAATIRFEAIVGSAQQESPFRTTVHFRGRGRFLRDGLEQLSRGSSLDSKPPHLAQ